MPTAARKSRASMSSHTFGCLANNCRSFMGKTKEQIARARTATRIEFEGENLYLGRAVATRGLRRGDDVVEFATWVVESWSRGVRANHYPYLLRGRGSTCGARTD